ncbi:hypothetical protein Tco_0533256 [Tanacetum coccineum]
MDDPNITMEEYISLEEEKARKRGKVFNWETAKYGKIWYDEDIHDLRSVETEFPAIAFNDGAPEKVTMTDLSYLRGMDVGLVNVPNLLARMDNLNITMKEYIMFEEEKARKHRKVFNWETAKYGKIWYDEDIHDLRSVETEFPAIAFNDGVSSEKTLSCEPTVSSLNDEIDFRILFDDSDDEDCTVIFEKNLFSYKIISTNDLKTDSENDNEKVNLPSLLSHEPTISCFDNLDFCKDFKNEFQAIVYNDAPTSKSDSLTEPILSPQHIDEFDLNDETSVSEYDEEEQNVLYFNDLFPFNIIHPDDLRSKKDNDDNKIDIIQSSGDMAHPLRDQRHQYLRYEGLQYSDADIVDFKARLTRIYMRELHRVHVFYFGGLSDLMAKGLSARMLMEHMDAQGASPELEAVYCSLRITYGGGDGVLRLIACSIAGRSQAPEKVTVTDLYSRLFAAGRKSKAHISCRQFVARLAEYFGLLTVEILRGLIAWVAMGPERQPNAATGAPGVAQDAPAVDEGVQAVLTPVQEPPPAARTMPQRMARLEEDMHQIHEALAE